jgi:hypothetical protein
MVLCCNWDLIGKQLVAIDGSKFRAVNSKKNNYNKEKIERHLAYIDNKIKEYLEEMDENDKKEKGNKQKVRVAQVKDKIEELKVLADKGYHNGEEIAKCKNENITTYVAPQQYKHNGDIPKKEYYREQFEYDEQKDIYTCPQGNDLVTNGKWYKRRGIRIKHYKSMACSKCRVKHLCTTSDTGRVIERHIYQKEVEENNKRVKENKEKYLKRQAIVEHPFGTIKRQ